MIDKVWVTSFVIIVVSIIFSFRRSERFTAYKVFYLFALFFFGIAPLVHYENKVAFFEARPLLKEEYFFLNIIIIAVIILFHFFYDFFIKKDPPQLYLPLKRNKIRDSYFIWVAFLFLLNKILLFREFSFSSLFLRGNNNFTVDFNQYLSYSVNALFYLLPLILVLHLLQFWKGSWNIFRIIAVSILIFSSFPTALSRTNFGILIAPMAFLIFPWFSKKNNFVFFFITGFLYFFPFLNQFRNIASLKELQFKPNFEVYKTAHFDSYYNFALIIFDVPIQWGNQLLGALLFFIPRDWWPTKPIGSGAYMAEFKDMSFTNLSANYFAEGYINFGFIGIALFLLVLCFLLSKLDQMGDIYNKLNSPFFVLYLQLIFSVFFLLRGDLMSSFANMTIVAFLNLVVIALLYRKTL